MCVSFQLVLWLEGHPLRERTAMNRNELEIMLALHAHVQLKAISIRCRDFVNSKSVIQPHTEGDADRMPSLDLSVSASA